jgi:3-oxoacyl-[acyl-carrier protein] reductase
VDSAETQLPAVDGVVVVVGGDAEPVVFTAQTPEEWDLAVNTTMWHSLQALQRAHASLLDVGGRVVVVTPTIGIAGAQGLVDYTTAVEGIRAMVKSAARQWASESIVVNMVSAPLALFAPGLAAPAAHLTASAVGDDSRLFGSVVETVKFLLRPDVGYLVGETVVVDGGSMMLP